MTFRAFDYGVLVENAPHVSDHFRHLSSKVYCDPTTSMMMVIGSSMSNISSKNVFFRDLSSYS